MQDQDLKPIYTRYSGNRKSEKLQIFQIGSKYRFLYQKLNRTNPSQAERLKGFKPQRLVVHEEVFEFDRLNQDFKDYAFHHLLSDLKEITPEQPS